MVVDWGEGSPAWSCGPGQDYYVSDPLPLVGLFY